MSILILMQKKDNIEKDLIQIIIMKVEEEIYIKIQNLYNKITIKLINNKHKMMMALFKYNRKKMHIANLIENKAKKYLIIIINNN